MAGTYLHSHYNIMTLPLSKVLHTLEPFLSASKLQTPLSTEPPLEPFSKLNSKSGCGYRRGIEVHIVLFYTFHFRVTDNPKLRTPSKPHCPDKGSTVLYYTYNNCMTISKYCVMGIMQISRIHLKWHRVDFEFLFCSDRLGLVKAIINTWMRMQFSKKNALTSNSSNSSQLCLVQFSSCHANFSQIALSTMWLPIQIVTSSHALIAQ